MPAATASSFLARRPAPFERGFTVVTVDGEEYTIARISELERRKYFNQFLIREAFKNEPEERLVEIINARFLQLVLWDSARTHRLLAVPDGTGGDAQFDTFDRLKEILQVDELHRADLLAEVLAVFPEYAAKKAPAAPAT